MTATHPVERAAVNARADAEAWHQSYKRHIDACPFACRRGGLCPVGERALANADDAGKRVRTARGDW